MKRNYRKVLLSLCIIAMSLSLIVGATFAIFESENKIKIPVSSGDIDITATTTITEAWSAEWDVNLGEYVDRDVTLLEGAADFTCGGKVFYDAKEQAVNLENIAPGDGVELKVELTNASTIKAKYNVSVARTGSNAALAKALKIEIDDSNLTGEEVEDGWRTADIPESGSASLGYATVKISLPMTEGIGDLQGVSCELAISVNAVQYNAHIEVETGDVILNSNFINKVNNAIASANVQSAPAIVFGTYDDHQHIVTAVDDYSSYEDGIEIPGEINARIFRVEDKTRMFRAAALGDTSIGMDALYVLAGNSITAAEQGNDSFIFADTEYIYVDMSGVDFSKTTSLGNMLQNSQIETLIMHGVDLSNVTDLENMFTGCEQTLKSVDFSGANLSNLKSMWSEFKAKETGDNTYESNNLESVNFSGANLSGLTTLEGAFAYDVKLTDVNFSGAILSNVEGMGAMFRSCTKLVSADFSEAKLPQLVSMASTDQGQALPNWGDGTYDVGMFDGCHALTDVNFADAEFGNLKDMSNLFHNCIAIESFTFSEVFSNCDLSTVTDIHHMFYYNIDLQYSPTLVSLLKSVDLSGVQFTSVEYVGGLFHGCSALETADFTDADLSSVTDTGTGMFLGCGSVKEILLTGADLGPAMCSNLFAGVGDAFETLDFSGADFEKVTDISKMFYVGEGEPSVIKEVSFKGAKNLVNVTNMSEMFMNCTKLVSVDFTDCDLSNVENMSQMFAGCKSLKEAHFSNITFTKLDGGSNNTSGMGYMFSNCTSLECVDFSNSEFIKLTTLQQLFSSAKVKKIDFSGAKFYEVNNASNFIGSSGQIEEIDFSDIEFPKCTYIKGIFDLATGLKSSLKTINLSGAKLSNMYGNGTPTIYQLFNNYTELTSVDLSNVNFEGVSGTGTSYTGIYQMFNGCTKLQTVNFSGANLSSVTNISSLFSGCTKLQTVNFSGATFGTLTSLANMFQNCTSLTSFDFSEIFAGIDLSAVTSMNYMFDGCSQLTSVDFSNVSLTAVTSMNYMFQNCSSLQELDLSEFDFANVNNMQYTFSGCSALIAIDLGAAGFTKSVRIDYLFQNCEKLAVIYVSQEVNLTNNWNSNAGNAFAGCEKLFELYPTYSTPTSGQAHGRTGNNGYFTVGSLKVDGVPED